MVATLHGPRLALGQTSPMHTPSCARRPERTTSTRHATQRETQKGPVGHEHRDPDPDLTDRWPWQGQTGGMTHDPCPAPPDPGDRQSITPVEPRVGPGLPSPVPADPRTQSARELARWENEGGRV
jgi:hypothetical protein